MEIFFMVMEFIEGQTLKELKRDYPKGMPVELTLNLMLQVMDGLSYAHENKIVHRDISAANIMIAGGNKVKIMDFGLAKLIEHMKSDQSIIAGTPLYIAPEQFLGDQIDWRSDIYSAGVVFFEAFTGAHPFKRGEKAEIHQFIAMPPKDPMELRSDLPPAIGQLLLKCIHKSMDKRYQSANEVKSEIKKIISSLTPTEPDEEDDEKTEIFS